MEYLYGLLFGTEPKQQSDTDARHALHAKLEALPDRDAQITLTAAELRILKEATTTTRAPQKHQGGDELFVRMHSNLTEDLDPSTADAVVDAYGASPLKPNPLAKRRPSPETPQLRKACKNAVADLISERQLASSVPKHASCTFDSGAILISEPEAFFFVLGLRLSNDWCHGTRFLLSWGSLQAPVQLWPCAARHFGRCPVVLCLFWVGKSSQYSLTGAP